MTLTRKDTVATSLVGLAVLAFLATHEAWNVLLIGDSHRWAAAVILVLGVGACAAGARRVTLALYSVLGGAAFALGALAIITGSLAPLLRDIEGLSTREAADIVDVGEAAFKSRLHQGRPRLRAALGDQAVIAVAGRPACEHFSILGPNRPRSHRWQINPPTELGRATRERFAYALDCGIQVNQDLMPTRRSRCASTPTRCAGARRAGAAQSARRRPQLVTHWS